MSQLNTISRIKGKIRILSGLHIGAGDSEMHIGGTDNPVVKHPHTEHPYIPGSSLKGKIRSLLEWRAGVVSLTNGKPLSAGDLKKVDANALSRAEAIVKLFGSSGDSKADAEKYGPTRASFWDCALDHGWHQNAKDQSWPLTEAKSENVIHRLAGVAEHPRNTERVPAGTEFEFNLSMKHLQDGDAALLDTLLEGMKLLEWDALGGSGSRGYGKLQFIELTVNGESIDSRFAAIDPFC